MTHCVGAMVVIRHDVDLDRVDEYLRWHSLEHLPERLALSGFRHAERWEKIKGNGPRFSCVIDVDSTDDLQTPEYLARLNAPTKWTRELMPSYRNVQRGLYEKLADIGEGVAPYQWCLRFNTVDRHHASSTIDWVTLTNQIIDTGYVTRVRVGHVHRALSSQRTEETRIRRTESTGDFAYLLQAGVLTKDASESVSAVVHQAIEAFLGGSEESLLQFSYCRGNSHPRA
ncbi:hypothetical protein Q3A80_31080 [Burkholderia sp. SR8]|uniref:hypothetical protein n=1 Tax=Burkholderia sp. SR8 TaxID=3062277 RepID=UPI0040641460